MPTDIQQRATEIHDQFADELDITVEEVAERLETLGIEFGDFDGLQRTSVVINRNACLFFDICFGVVHRIKQVVAGLDLSHDHSRK
jgi:hypothetical protein